MSELQLQPPMEMGATFSPCERYRYRLHRILDRSLPVMVWVMLNPSTADYTKDDPTIRKCQGFARRREHGGVIILNIFAWRSTDPKVLPRIHDPIGPENDAHIDAVMREIAPTAECVLSRGTVVAAWGADPAARFRGGEVVERIRRTHQRVWFLGLTADGSPKHPLYLPYETPFELLPERSA